MIGDAVELAGALLGSYLGSPAEIAARIYKEAKCVSLSPARTILTANVVAMKRAIWRIGVI